MLLGFLILVGACVGLVPAAAPATEAGPVAVLDHTDGQAETVADEPTGPAADPGPIDEPDLADPRDQQVPSDEPGTPIDRTGLPSLFDRPIVAGDTLWDIARHLTGDGPNYAAIWAATDLANQSPPLDPANPDLIFPGNVMQVPTTLMPDTVIVDVFAELIDAAQPDEPPIETAPNSSPADGTQLDRPARPAPTAEPQVSGDRAAGDRTQATQHEEAGPVTAPSLAAPALAAVATGTGLTLVAGAALVRVTRRRSRQHSDGHRPSAATHHRRSRRGGDEDHQLWPPEALAAGWSTLLPLDPRASQPWCVRWNSDTDTLECAWTDDPSRDQPDMTAATVPGPGSPWTTVIKTGRDHTPKPVWSLPRDQTPATAPIDVLPAMVNCVAGRSDRPTGDGFFLNLEAVGVIAIESVDPDAPDPAGVARGLLTQLDQHDTGADLYLLNTTLGYRDLDDKLNTDPLQLESHLVETITDQHHLWDQSASVLALRSTRTYQGPTIVVAGPADDLQSCSHLLSLAQAPNVPLVVIAFGSLSHAWASLTLEPDPDKHTIRFPALGTVLTFDHLSWATTEEATTIVDLAVDTHQPPTHRDDLDPTELDAQPIQPDSTTTGEIEPADTDTDDHPPPPWATGPLTGHHQPPDPTSHLFTEHRQPAPAATDPTASSPAAQPSLLLDTDLKPDAHPNDSPRAAKDPALDSIDDGIDPWDILSEADPRSLADEPSSAPAPSFAEHDLNHPVGPDNGRAGSPSMPDPALGPHQHTGNGSAVERTNRPHTNPAGRTCDDTDEVHNEVASDRPAGPSGLRLEFCGPIRLLRRSPDNTTLSVVPIGGDGGITVGQLGLLAFLAFHNTQPGGGVATETITNEFWPTYHRDGTRRHVRADTVKSRVWELRKALAKLIDGGDAKSVVPDATDQHYQLHGIATDWTDLKAAITRAEVNRPGTPQHTDAVETIASLLRPPGLLTPPTARQARTMFAWTDHIEPLVHDVTRRLNTILADHATHLTNTGQPKEALKLLAAARTASTTYAREIADANVAALLALGDPTGAETECVAYERQYQPDLVDREQPDPTPGNPRARLNNAKP